MAGICAAPDAGTAGAAGTALTAGASAAADSSTLPELAGRRLPKYAKASVQTKNTVASTAVVRDKKLALPLAPNKLPELPIMVHSPQTFPSFQRRVQEAPIIFMPY